jgi:hypothetical protein
MGMKIVQCADCGTRMAESWRPKHVCHRRNGEPPAPWSLALARRRAAAPAQKVLRDADGTPMGWSTALAARAAEGR